ncbi:MAG: two-component sensor histidine kinase, partial [Mesorhizobium sp.]
PGRLQSIPGAGLGLAIAKEIIERYGGTIALENRAGGGLSQRVAFRAVS